MSRGATGEGRVCDPCGSWRRLRDGNRRSGPDDLEASEATSRSWNFRASAEEAEGTIRVVGRSDGSEASAEALVAVVEEIRGSSSEERIPEPEFLNEPAAPWRSRLVDGRWQINAGHRDYRAIHDRPALKLRFLALLFAKEVVLRSSQDPRLERALEQLVEVAAYADRNLAEWKGRRASTGGPGEAS